jgi:hypothetical protein
MHELEPYSNWRHIYESEKDPLSPFYGRTYNEFEYTQTVYNFYIHPQWDFFESPNLYMKILMADYEEQYAIIELIGEWNDAIDNDIMNLRREVTDKLEAGGICKFIIIAENVLNFHSSDDSYYEDWFENVMDNNGWIILLNLPQQSQYDFTKTKLHRYIELQEVENWRVYKPIHLYRLLNEKLEKRLGEG